MGQFHAARLAENSNAEFVGCFDIDRGRAKAVANRFGVVDFEDMESMLRALDAVSVAVPTNAHWDVASQFLEAGKAVLIEKPIASDLESAEKLVAVADKNESILQIGHSERFNPAFMAVEKSISDPKFVEIHRLAPPKGRGDDVAVILDLMVHDLDLIMALTGSLPEKIDAVGVAVITDSVDIANARLSFPGGCVANITASRISIKEMRKLRVFEKSGYTSIDMAARTAERYLVVDQHAREYKNAPVFGRFQLPDGRAVVRDEVEIPSGDNLQYEIESFIEAAEKEHPPAVSGRDGLNVLRVAAEIEKCCQDYLKNL